MSNLSPFEIRLDLLKMAKDLLIDDFNANKDKLVKDWQVKVEVAKLNGTAIPDHPTLPKYPTDADIIEKAQSLNGFVSNTSEAKPKSAKTEKINTPT